MTANQSGWRLFFKSVKSAIVVMERGETAEEAWRRHVKGHPEDRHAEVKIFHFDFPPRKNSGAGLGQEI